MNMRTLFSGVGLVFVAAILLLSAAVINNLGGSMRIDLTDQKLYSLSEGSQNIVKSADKPINLYYFFSEKVSEDIPQLRNYAKRVEELLQEYVLLSDGKLVLHKVDPEPFSEEEDQATEYGLQAVPIAAGGDKLYFGLVAVTESGEKEIISFFQPDKEEFLEYDISKLIYKVINTEPVTVGLLSTLEVDGGFDMMTRQRKPSWMVMDQIKQLFEVKTVPTDTDAIDKAIDVLMIVHPKLLPEKTLYAIDQFVLGGGKAIAFVDPSAESDVSEMGLMSENTERYSDLEQLFKAWGINYSIEQVLGDGRYAMHVNLGAGRRTEPHLGVLAFDREAMSSDDIITSQLESINFSSSGVLGAAEGATTQFTPLVSSSNQSMLFDRVEFQTMGEPRDLFNKFKPKGDYYVVAARVQGPVKTAFPQGRPKVTPDAKSDDKSAAEKEPKKDADKAESIPQLTSSDNINVIVVADTDVLSDRLWVQVQDFFGQRVAQPWASNGSFVVNSIDNLGGSADLIKIRSRGHFTRPFTLVDELERQAEVRFREQEQNLMQTLKETEDKLAALQKQPEDGSSMVELSDEQKAEVAKFEHEKLQIRKKLREVQHQLNQDIDALGTRLKAINIGAVPVFLTVLALMMYVSRVRSRKRAV